jgi:hypothetical protein
MISTGLGMPRCAPLWILAGLATAAPAAAEPVTWADLEGATVEAEQTRNQVVRRQRELKFRLDDQMKVIVEPDNVINFSFRTTAHTPQGSRKLPPLGGMFTLDQQRPIGSYGGGKALWTFKDGSLEFIRTFLSGALRIIFAFERGADGNLTCNSTFAFAREDGSGEIRMLAVNGEEQTLVRAELVSSQCKVSKKN